MDELIADFITEASESLEVVDVELVNFEAHPDDRSALDKIFRLVHTLKGTCGFLGLARLEAVAHAGETLLGRFRDGVLEVTPQAVTLVLRSVDRIKLILSELAATGAETEGDDSALIAELEAMAEGASQPTAVEPIQPGDFDPGLGRVLRPGEVSAAELEAAFAAAEGPVAPVIVEDVASSAPLPSTGETAAPAALASATAEGEVAAPVQGAQTIRVGVDVLEGMMTLVSELVLTRNQLLQINRSRDDGAFSPPLQRLSTITGELQESVMKTRMQPIGAAWKKLPRLVRDLAQDLGKKIDLVMEGEATELDRQVLELIRDPLTHLVRNSADHGLEDSTERRAAGKPETGKIRLSAFHEGGTIVIRIADDGRGLNTARIREKAIENGLIGRADAEALSEAQVHKLIFAPGFSTAASVTNVSGRGVGMDVVRSNIEQIGGQIELSSTPGVGACVTIKIPLTLAIVSSLIVGAGHERFAIPQGVVLELIRIGEGAEHRVETIDQERMVRLRDALVPLLDLASELEISGRRQPAGFAMIMQVGQHRFGVVVDEVVDTEEIVVKPLAAALRNVSLFSGATILGDGSVVLIIDPNALAERASEISSAAFTASEEARQFEESLSAQKQSVLIVRAGGDAPKAVELSKVTRLEHAQPGAIEHLAGRSVLQYRGRLMPILRVDDRQSFASSSVQPLLVFTGQLYAMGLAVDEIVDVVEAVLDIELTPTRPGIVGTAVIAGKATEILDVDHYLLRALAEHVREGDRATSSESLEAA